MIDAFSALEALLRWMAWREERRGSERARPTKVPYAAGEGNYGSSGGWGSATDASTWGTHAQAEARARQLDDGRKVGCGIVLGDLGDKTYLGGADLDSSLDENGALACWAVRIITVLQTYAEVSPGGRGLKAFFRIPAELVRWLLDLIGVETDAWGCKRGIPWLDGTNHGAGIEIYTSARYFTVTGRIWSIDHPHIVTLDRDQLVALAALIPPLPGRSAPSGATGNGAVGGRAEPGMTPPRNSRDNSRSARAARIAITLMPDTYDDMVDGLRNHAGDDIKAWVEDKGEARNERELKRIWERIVAERTSTRAAGLAALEERTGASEGIEPVPAGPEPKPPGGNGHDPSAEEGSDSPIVDPGGSGSGGGGGSPEPSQPGDLDPGELELPGPDDGDGDDGRATQESIEEDRARIEAAMEEKLATLNRHFAVVNEAGKCIVFKRTRDPAFDNREVLERITFDDFARMYLNRWVEVIGRTVTKKGVEYAISKRKLAPWWLEHARRRQHLGGVTFDPTNRSPGNFLNLWRGFAVKPSPGNWSLMKNHIVRVICRGEEDHAEYVLNWLARLVQRPEEPGEVALVIRSTEKGTGKSLFGRYVVKLFGHHGMHITHAPHLTGRFNAHLHDCCVLFADEAFFAGDKTHEGALKGLITEYTLVIEGKYRNAITVRNRLHVVIVSNKDWVVPASIDERRWAVFEALDIHQGDRAYFRAIVEQMESGGLAAMLHELQARDISGFEVRDMPQTAALQAQKALSLTSLQRWWLTVLARGFLWKSRHGAPWFTDWHDFYSTELLMRSYQQWCDENRPFDRWPREQLGAFFSALHPASRPARAHPVYEIDSIDRQAVDVITDSSGSVTTVPKSLDEIAIVTKCDQQGYRVGDLDEARASFADQQLRDIPAPWAAIRG